MKKYDKTFFIMYNLTDKEYYDSCIGIDELARILGKTRLAALRSLRNYLKKDSYIKTKDNKKLILLDDFILGGKKNERKRYKKSK